MSEFDVIRKAFVWGQKRDNDAAEAALVRVEARVAELEAEVRTWKRLTDDMTERSDAAEAESRRTDDLLVELAAKLERAETELRYAHDRGDHLVYRHEWEEFDRWQRWADDQRKEAEKYQPTAQEFNDAMEGR